MPNDTLTLRYGRLFRLVFWFALGGSALLTLLFAALALLAPPAAPGQRVALGLLIVGFATGGIYCLRERHCLQETFIVSAAALSRTDAVGRVSTLSFDQIGAVRRNLFAGYFTIVSRDGATRWRIYDDLPYSQHLCHLAQQHSTRAA